MITIEQLIDEIPDSIKSSTSTESDKPTSINVSIIGKSSYLDSFLE